MAVYDRWHRKPGPGAQPCRCGRGKTPLYPSAEHLKGDRWQVRWYDDTGKQRSRNFALKEGRNPGVHAEAFDAEIRHQLDTGEYIDPWAGMISFREYAEQWRTTRLRDDPGKLERSFRLHVYPVLGPIPLRKLARQPSLIQGWIGELEAKLAPVTARQLVTDVSGVFLAAAADGLVQANPVRSSSVTRPRPAAKKPRAWAMSRVEAMTAALPGRFAVIPLLGAGTGMRQGELFGLAAEDVTFLGRDPKIAVTRQLKIVDGQPRFAPPKRGKTRETPMSAGVAQRLARHMELYPPVAVTLAWHEPRNRLRHGKPVTVRLVLSAPRGGPLRREAFNKQYWHPALAAAGITRTRDEGMHALRHTFASLQLSAGASVTDVASWMGDTPAVVLGTYAHFMPGNEGRGRAAVEAFIDSADARNVPDGRTGRALWLVNATCPQIT